MDFILLFELLKTFIIWCGWLMIYGCASIIVMFLAWNLIKFFAPGAYKFLINEFNEMRGY